MLDLLIIGAGPAGLSAAYTAKQHGLNYQVVERGLIADTIYKYPIGLTVFSTINELELRPGDLKPAREKPTREELLSYYVRFALEERLNINTEETVIDVRETDDGAFEIASEKTVYQAKRVLFAIGATAHSRKLNVPGEDLPKVHHRFVEAYPYVRKDAMVVGGGNSAAEASLFLAEEGARTTLAILRADWENRDPKMGAIKHWVREPINRQIELGRLTIFLLKNVVEIREREIVLEGDTGKIVTLPNDAVFIQVGADADLTLLKRLGVETEMSGKHCEIPVYDQETGETNVAGVFVAGHFTHHRHIVEAIRFPKQIVPLMLGSDRQKARSAVVNRVYAGYCES